MNALPDGWLAEEEAVALAGLARDKTVLELGAWQGRSTVVLAETARYVVSVDRHQGIEEISAPESLSVYLANVRDLPNVAIVVARFEDFIPLLSEWRFDLAYIDGDHDADAVRRDTALVLPLAIPIVAYHDWDFPSVRDTVTAKLGKPDSVVGSLASYNLR